jgi:hypothetical protein
MPDSAETEIVDVKLRYSRRDSAELHYYDASVSDGLARDWRAKVHTQGSLSAFQTLQTCAAYWLPKTGWVWNLGYGSIVAGLRGHHFPSVRAAARR